MQDVKVRINEHYGDPLLPLEFPDDWKVNVTEMACKGSQPMTDEEIRNFLDNTVGSANIIEQAKGKKGRIVVTCDDLSRPTPAGRVFPFIVEQLHEAGVADHQIFITPS
jgi:nickel-dependent lactate racemase